MQTFEMTPSEKAMAETLLNVTKENSQEDAKNIPLIEIEEVVAIPSSKSLSSADCKYEDREANDRHEYEEAKVVDFQKAKFVYEENGMQAEEDSGSQKEEGVSEVETEPRPAPVDFEAVVESERATVTSSAHSVVETMVDEVTSQQSTQGGQLKYNLFVVFTFWDLIMGHGWSFVYIRFAPCTKICP